MRKFYLYLTFFVLLLLMATTTNAQQYSLQRWVFGSGGTVALSDVNNNKLYGITGQTAIQRLVQDNVDNILYQGFWVPYEPPTDVEDNPISLSTNLTNYPNPFNYSTTVRYNLPSTAFVTIRIYDNVGRIMKELFSGVQPGGQNEVLWNGKDNNGYDVSAGSYLYELNVRPAQMAGRASFDSFNLRNIMVVVR